ncbi:hypothetical protein [Pseudosulfitobacter sp. DSM 107133]|jgi:hypothetical protein|uniref:hypothetical protein n=1 Tax=Pseudosulfitobacter sp. DSM 107133 TaxID=2883100 RepID=UPI0019654DCD|nr:hypothetical protein [Pseudosulfitobacter sp. DSM 107133]UOA25843.1 hypothetical protein DSM107133_00531 [Pseudosulfitobacter sp. DSM 107133]
MIRLTALFSCLALVAACGGGTRYSSYNAQNVRLSPVALGQQAPKLFASGPIAKACQASGRKQADRARCGCVQAVADMSLSASDQRRAVGFFSDPHSAQEIRTSSSASNEAFWKRWKAFGDQAGQLCS